MESAWHPHRNEEHGRLCLLAGAVDLVRPPAKPASTPKFTNRLKDEVVAAAVVFAHDRLELWQPCLRHFDLVTVPLFLRHASMTLGMYAIHIQVIRAE